MPSPPTLIVCRETIECVLTSPLIMAYKNHKTLQHIMRAGEKFIFVSLLLTTPLTHFKKSSGRSCRLKISIYGLHSSFFSEQIRLLYILPPRASQFLPGLVKHLTLYGSIPLRSCTLQSCIRYFYLQNSFCGQYYCYTHYIPHPVYYSVYIHLCM